MLLGIFAAYHCLNVPVLLVPVASLPRRVLKAARGRSMRRRHAKLEWSVVLPMRTNFFLVKMCLKVPARNWEPAALLAPRHPPPPPARWMALNVVYRLIAKHFMAVSVLHPSHAAVNSWGARVNIAMVGRGHLLTVASPPFLIPQS